ncbi:MAG: SDH family Clp fold serine proteinase, partial [Pirellulales bacterium]
MTELESKLSADGLALFGPLLSGIDHSLRAAIESFSSKSPKLFVVLDTGGGVVEVVERIVDVMRHHYQEVHFFVPDVAMSAGTVLAMSGDAIFMDYFSRLGPIDPQVVKDGKLVPALSYLSQFNRLIALAKKGELSHAEFALLAKMDLAEIHGYEQARNLTRTLLRRWLATYKFKNWHITQSRQLPVDDAMRQQRAEEIANLLSDNERWHSHGRGISMETLRANNLKIEDFSADAELGRLVRSYHSLLKDFALGQKRSDD